MARRGVTRRHFLGAATLAALTPLAGCAAHRHNALDEVAWPTPDGTPPLPGFAETVLGFGPVTGPPLLLLHELPGMTRYDVKLAYVLGKDGFRVYVPLLFGSIGQSSTPRGFWQACLRGPFECTSRATRSPVLDRLDRVIDRIASLSRNRPIGVIGMCLTGIMPLALLRAEVAAAVLCQPTVPFSSLLFRPVGAQKSDLGLSPADVGRASRSPVPFLTMRYADDTLCPPERVAVLERTFPGRMATIAVTGTGHSVLARSYDQQAYGDARRYLQLRLGVTTEAQTMAVATFGGQACEITPQGTWRARPRAAAQA